MPILPQAAPPSFPPSLLPVQAARPSLITPAHSFLFSPKVVILTPVGKTSRRAPRGWGRESTWGQAACRAGPQDLGGGGGSVSLCVGWGADWGWMVHMVLPTMFGTGWKSWKGWWGPSLTSSSFTLSTCLLVPSGIWPELLYVAAAGSRERESRSCQVSCPDLAHAPLLLPPIGQSIHKAHPLSGDSTSWWEELQAPAGRGGVAGGHLCRKPSLPSSLLLLAW